MSYVSVEIFGDFGWSQTDLKITKKWKEKKTKKFQFWSFPCIFEHFSNIFVCCNAKSKQKSTMRRPAIQNTFFKGISKVWMKKCPVKNLKFRFESFCFLTFSKFFSTSFNSFEKLEHPKGSATNQVATALRCVRKQIFCFFLNVKVTPEKAKKSIFDYFRNFSKTTFERFKNFKYPRLQR